MKKFKLLLWLIVLGLIALVVYQNLEVLMTQHDLSVDLGVKKIDYNLHLGVMLLGLFLAGLLVAYFFSLAHRFKARKTIRKLNEELTIERKKVAELESQIRKDAPPAPSATPESGPAAESPQSSGQGRES